MLQRCEKQHKHVAMLSQCANAHYAHMVVYYKYCVLKLRDFSVYMYCIAGIIGKGKSWRNC